MIFGQSLAQPNLPHCVVVVRIKWRDGKKGHKPLWAPNGKKMGYKYIIT